MVWNCLRLCPGVVIGTAFRVSHKVHIIIIHCFCLAVCECRTVSLYTFTKRSQLIAVCDSFACVKPVLGWANVCFASLGWGIRRTATKLYSGSRKLSSTCSGEHCLWLVESKESSPVDEEEIKIKMDARVYTSLATEGIALFVDL